MGNCWYTGQICDVTPYFFYGYCHGEFTKGLMNVILYTDVLVLVSEADC